jgi:OOP family OmpA-OmpF porin
MSTRAFWSLVIALVFLQPLAVDGQSVKPADRGPWEISAFMGGFDDDFEFDPDGSEFFVDPEGNPLFGGGLNYHLPANFFVGLEGRYVPVDMRPAAGGFADLNSYFFSGLLGYTIPLHERFDIYGVGGATVAYWSPTDYDAETDFGYSFGGGAKLFLTESLALIGDYRMFQIPTAMEDVSQDVAGIIANEKFWGYSITGGFSYFFGTKDSDGDGVKDGDDLCPRTPAGVEVDAQGCPVDSDGDGVPDFMDRCPNTPAGAEVGSEGCPFDSDSDGVFDGLDRCPGTPAGAEVDANGCPMDSDGDGVFDGLDRCPGTPRGTEVDSVGCPLPEPEPEPEPEVFTFQGGVNFEFDSAVLTAEGQAALREIGDVLAAREGITVTVEGHTDSMGDDAYNMGLSRRRAEAVRDFLGAGAG